MSSIPIECEPVDPICEPKWVTEYSSQIIERYGYEEEINISTGISLSGPVHVGHLREFMVGAIVCQSLINKGYKANLLAFADDMDPLKRRYEFLPEEYNQYIGVPLYLIPSNFQEDISYSDFFLRDFINSLHELGINPTIIKSSEVYNSGRYDNTIKEFMRDRKEIQTILRNVSGSKKENVWPFKFVCPECSSSTETTVLQYNEENGNTEIECKKCKHESQTNISNNGGKLMWRFDWPARWKNFNIHAEPVAQDHASKGGSYDSSESILFNYFGKESPVPLKYAWVKNRANSDLHTKSGVTSVKQLVASYPAYIIWSMYALTEPSKPIFFDFKDSLGDEIRKYQVNKEILRSLVPQYLNLSPIFETLDLNTIANFIKTKRPLRGISDKDRETIRSWVSASSENHNSELSIEEKEFVCGLKNELSQLEEWKTVQIKEAIMQFVTNKEISVKEAARILYKGLFSAESGPNIAQYFSELSKEEVLSKLSFN